MTETPTRKKYQTMVLLDYGTTKIAKQPLAGGPAPTAPAPAPAPAPSPAL